VSKSFEKYKERRAERMRLGQSTCIIVEGIPSDSEFRMALVPLTDAEQQNAIEEAASRLDIPDNEHGILAKDKIQMRAVIASAGREVGNLKERMFVDAEDLLEFDSADINLIWDYYREMMAEFSPSIEEMPQEDFDAVKKAFQRLNASELSGSAWYALRRFLLTVGAEPQQDKSPGSTSTNSSTTKNEEAEFTVPV
jgi:hypothetical protein